MGDRISMAFSSSMVSGGQGVGVVTATGQDTEIGKISDMLAEVETLETPLTKQMNSFGKRLTLLILVAAVLLFLAGRFLHGQDLARVGPLGAVAGRGPGHPADRRGGEDHHAQAPQPVTASRTPGHPPPVPRGAAPRG